MLTSKFKPPYMHDTANAFFTLINSVICCRSSLQAKWTKALEEAQMLSKLIRSLRDGVSVQADHHASNNDVVAD